MSEPMTEAERAGGIGELRFDRRISVEHRTDGMTACWVWSGSPNHDGYGRYHVGGRPGRNLRAHRYAYESLIGPIPSGLVLDHLCRVRACVNPFHLEPVTQGENVRRGDLSRPNSGSVQRSRTHCLQGHEYNAENTYLRSNGNRRCRACDRDQARARAAALRTTTPEKEN